MADLRVVCPWCVIQFVHCFSSTDCGDGFLCLGDSDLVSDRSNVLGCSGAEMVVRRRLGDASSGIRFESIERVGTDAMFTVSVAVFLSMSSGLFGLHDVWTPAVVMLAGAIVVAVLRERCDSSGSTMFQRYAGLSSALVAIAWVPVFLTQPVAA